MKKLRNWGEQRIDQEWRGILEQTPPDLQWQDGPKECPLTLPIPPWMTGKRGEEERAENFTEKCMQTSTKPASMSEKEISQGVKDCAFGHDKLVAGSFANAEGDAPLNSITGDGQLGKSVCNVIMQKAEEMKWTRPAAAPSGASNNEGQVGTPVKAFTGRRNSPLTEMGFRARAQPRPRPRRPAHGRLLSAPFHDKGIGRSRLVGCGCGACGAAGAGAPPTRNSHFECQFRRPEGRRRRDG